MDKYINLIKVINASVDEISQELKELATVLNCLNTFDDKNADNVVFHTARSVKTYAAELDEIIDMIADTGVA